MMYEQRFGRKAYAVLKWPIGIVAAVLTLYLMSRAMVLAPIGLTRYTLTYWISYLVAGLVLTFIIHPRRGWLLGTLLGIIVVTWHKLVIILIGARLYGSFLVSMEEWWANVGIFSLVYSLIEIVGSGLGGQIGIMLRYRLVDKKPDEASE